VWGEAGLWVKLQMVSTFTSLFISVMKTAMDEPQKSDFVMLLLLCSWKRRNEKNMG
jgi:hypothetical protein